LEPSERKDPRSGRARGDDHESAADAPRGDVELADEHHVDAAEPEVVGDAAKA
jgi:hypothetical protein